MSIYSERLEKLGCPKIELWKIGGVEGFDGFRYTLWASDNEATSEASVCDTLRHIKEYMPGKLYGDSIDYFIITKEDRD